MNLRVLLADDQALLRSTFRLLIDSNADMDCVGEASNGQVAVQLARREHPDVILMDIRMPEMDGIQATERISADPELEAVKVIILTTFETEELVVSALRAGASGYLGKDVEPAALLGAIRTVSAGDSLLSPTATRALISRVVAGPKSGSIDNVRHVDELTPRELEILALVGLGHSNQQIAEQLFITTTTAKTHVNRTMQKLHAHDRAQLVIAAYEAGLIEVGRNSSL